MGGIPFGRGAYLIAGAMFVLAMSACSSSDSEEIYGVWITPGDHNMSFNEDGSWFVVPAADPEDIRAFGTFTLDGELLTFTFDPDSKVCSQNIGIYDAAFTADGDLEVNDVDDPCVVARSDLTGTLVRYSP